MLLVNQIVKQLQGYSPNVVDSKSSIYIRLSNSKIKQIRVSDHNGRKTSRNCIEVRTDAMTSRKTRYIARLTLNMLYHL